MLYEVDIAHAMPALAFDFLCSVFKKHRCRAHTASIEPGGASISVSRQPQSDLQQPVVPGFRGGYPEYLAWRMMSSLTLKFRRPDAWKCDHPTRFPDPKAPVAQQPARSFTATPEPEAHGVTGTTTVGRGHGSAGRRSRVGAHAPMPPHDKAPQPVGGHRNADPRGHQGVVGRGQAVVGEPHT